MLLTLLNWYASGGPPPRRYSSGYGTLCLEAYIETTTLEGAVLVSDLEATIEQTTLTYTYTC